MAVLRFLLAMIYTVFSRYDKNGDEVDPEDDINYLTDNWIEVFRSGKFPMKPFEKYFENGMTVSGCLMRSIRFISLTR